MLTVDQDHDSAPRAERVGDGEVARTGSVLHGLARAAYDRIDAVNWSKLKLMLKSPAHYRHNLLQRGGDSDAKRRGRVTHLSVLEPQRFQSDCVVWDGGPRRGKDWEKFKKAHADVEIVTEAEYETCAALGAAVRSDPTALAYLSNGKSEVTVQWRSSEPDSGAVAGWDLACKGRLDFLAANAIVDLKTTRAASEHGFAAESHRYRYDCQAAYYVDGYEAATGIRPPYVIVAVEVDAPHVVTVFRVPDEILARGRETYRDCLQRLAFCTRENVWPAYTDGEVELRLPPWVSQRDDDDISDLDLVIGE